MIQQPQPVTAAIDRKYHMDRQGKLCECGCGQPAPIATRTSPRYGTVKGQPQRFILGHRWRITDWWTHFRAEDRGYKTPCHIWTGHINKATGYGFLRRSPLHRLIYERACGPLAKGMEPDHLCRVRACMRLDHLEAVTHRENCQRSPLIGRALKARKGAA